MRIFATALIVGGVVYAADRISVYESDHFELITDGPKSRAQEMLAQFERVRAFFTQGTTLQDPLMKPRVVVFNSDKDFREVSPSEAAGAYYTPMPHRDMIAIGGAQGRAYDMPKVVHEYAHMLVRYTEAEYPLWMNEGIAELFSTIQPRGKSIQLGAPIPYHVMSLRDTWMGLENVVGVDASSPIYNRRAHAGGFYALSWALMHMLQLGPKYRPGFSKFLAAITRGTRTDDALQEVYGKSIAQVDLDLRDYVRQQAVTTLVVDGQFDKSWDKVQPREVTQYEWELARADLLTATRKFELARTRLEALTKSDPARPEAWESLTFLHWVSRSDSSREDASKTFAKALELKTTNPNLIYYANAFTRDYAQVRNLLQSLMERFPAHVDGRLRLAEALLYTGAYDQSYDEVKKITRITPRRIADYFPVMIQASWYAKKLAESRGAAMQYRRIAKTDAEKASAQKWYVFSMREPAPDRVVQAVAEPNSVPPAVEGEEPGRPRLTRTAVTPPPPPPPPSEYRLEEGNLDVVKEGEQVRIFGAKATMVEGVLTNLECKDPQAVLNIQQDDNSVVRLLIEDPTNINLKMGTESKMELQCGPQMQRVKAGYFPRANDAEKTIGALATLEFLK
jgi:tetratricopeptide (TPR) repeat protein